jgi:hypothetical protein
VVASAKAVRATAASLLLRQRRDVRSQPPLGIGNACRDVRGHWQRANPEDGRHGASDHRAIGHECSGCEISRESRFVLPDPLALKPALACGTGLGIREIDQPDLSPWQLERGIDLGQKLGQLGIRISPHVRQPQERKIASIDEKRQSSSSARWITRFYTQDFAGRLRFEPLQCLDMTAASHEATRASSTIFRDCADLARNCHDQERIHPQRPHRLLL